MGTTRLAVSAAAILLFMSHAAAAQELKPAAPIVDQKSSVPADVEVTLAPNWQVGDRYRIEHTKQREEIRRGQRLPSRTSRSLTGIEIIEANGTGYVLAATLAEADLSNFATPDQGGADAASLFTELFRGRTMEYVTNENGVPVGLRNKEDIVELMRSTMDGVLPLWVPDPQQREQVRATMTQMMTPAFIEAMVIKDAIIFYGLLGGIYQGGPAQAYDLPMQFPFSQSSVDATLYVLLRRVEDGGGTVHISTQNVPDPAHMKRTMEDWFRGVVKAQGQELPPGFRLPEFAMQDTTDYVMDRNRGLPTEVRFERFVRMGDEMLRVDRDVFRLMPAD